MKQTGCNVFRRRPGTALLWALNIAVILTVSYFGRRLESLVRESIGREGAAWLLGAGVAALLIVAGIALFRRRGWPGLLHLLWMAALAGGLMLHVGRHPARWLHIPFFGTFGFLSARLFTLRTAAEVAFAFSVLDEVFQHYLPDRVGDPEDMVINAVCAAAGIVFFLIIRGIRGRTCATDSSSIE